MAKTKIFILKDLHDQIIEHVVDLRGDNDITLRILYPEGCLANIKPISSEFSNKTGVNISFQQTGVDNITTQLILETAKQSSRFDIALPATFGIPDLVEAGTLASLDEYVAKYEPEDFQKGSLYSLGDYYKNHFYGYQTDGDTYLMFYNKTWLNDPTEKSNFLKQFGYPLDIPKTWRELDDMMCFFQRPEKNMYGGCLYRNTNYVIWEWWIRFHAECFYPLDDNLKPQINNQSGIKALNDLIKATDYLHPDVKSAGLFENWQRYAQGNVFCNIGWGGTQKYLHSDQSKMKEHLAFGPTPGGLVDGQLINTPYFNWGWNYVVLKSSPVKEMAYLFTLFASSPKMSTEAVKQSGGYFDPFRPEHYDDPDIIKSYSQDFLEAHKASMSESMPDFYLTGQGLYFNALKENINLALQNKLSAQEALDLTAGEWERITQKMGHDAQKEQWRFLKSQYPTKLKKILK